MRYQPLGRTGLLVSEICLGTMTFGGRGGIWTHIGDVDQAAADRIVARAADAGVNFIDTADVYSEGWSEEITGRAMVNSGRPRTDFVLASKVLGGTGKGPNDRGASRGHIMDAVKASLKRLDTDYIDLYQIHGQDLLAPVEETVRALDDLVRQGHVRYVGCSNWAAWKIMQALGLADSHGWARFASLQAFYTIASRDLEREIAPLLQDQGVGLMVWSPLAGGLLSGKYDRDGKGPDGARRTTFDFPIVDKDACLRLHRRHAADGRGARRLGGAHRHRLAAAPALRHHGDRRRAQHRPARRQYRRHQDHAFGRGAGDARHGERTATRISRLDDRAPDRRPPPGLKREARPAGPRRFSMRRRKRTAQKATLTPPSAANAVLLSE